VRQVSRLKFKPGLLKAGFFYAAAQLHPPFWEKMKIFKIYIILFFIPAVILAQSAMKIKGRVFDSATGNPLPGTNIIINGSNKGTVADMFGNFSFENLINGTYSITAQHIGYKTAEITGIIVRNGLPANLNIGMTQVVLPLNEISIIEDRNSLILTEDKKIITLKQIQASGATNLPNLFRHIQGVTVQSGNSSTISIRGSLPQHILILIDGVPLSNNLSGITDITDIPLNIIDHIEIYKSGASWKFGSGAISGAVNIITKKAADSNRNLTLSGGSFSDCSLAFNSGGLKGRFNYLISAMYRYSGNNFPYSYNLADSTKISDIRRNNDITNSNILLKTGYSTEKNKIKLSVFLNHSGRGLPGKVYSLTPYARTTRTHKKADLTYKFICSSFYTNFNIYISDRKSENKNILPENAPLKYRRYPAYNYINRVLILGADSKIVYSPFNKASLQAGINLKDLSFSDENLLSPSANSIDDATDRSATIFCTAELNRHLFSFMKATLQSSLHYDIFSLKSHNQERREKQLSPSAGISFTIGKKSKLFTNTIFSKSFRVPTFADLFYQDFRIQGKPDLLPERGKSILAGAGFFIALNHINIKAEASHFYNKIQNLIVWRLGSFEVFRPYNTNAEIEGTEYNFELNIRNIKFTLSQTNVSPVQKDNNITTQGMILPYRAQKLLKSGFHITEPWVKASVYYQYSGIRYVNEANTIPLDPYSIIDLSFEKLIKLSNHNIRLNLSVYNLLDKKYQTVRDMPAKGRTWQIVFNLNL